MAAERVTRSVRFTIRRVEGDRAIVEGIAYPALDPVPGQVIPRDEAELRIDSWGTFMRRETLETMAHRFLEYSRPADSQHDHGVIGTIVESYVTRAGDPAYPPDVWVAKVKVHDPGVIQQLDDEELTGFSIEILAATRRTDVQVEGVGRTTIGELLDPIPLFLSLVDRPATGQPFANVANVARAAPPAGTHLVRCAPPEEPMTKKNAEARAAEPVETAAAETTTPKTDASPAPTTTPEPTAPAVKVRDTGARDKAVAEAVAEVVTRSAGKLTAERAAEIRTRATNRTDFAETWKEIAPALRAWGAFWDAKCLLCNVAYEIQYSVDDQADAYPLLQKAAQDFAAVVEQIMAEAMSADAAEEKTEPAAMAARAGRKISSARMQKIKYAQSRAAEAAEGLGALITEVEGEPEAETDEEPTTETKSASKVDARASGDMPSPPASTPDPIVALRAEIDALKATVTAQAATDADLVKARADLDAANRRVAELEARRPAGRSSEPEITTPAPARDPQPNKRSNWGQGVLLRHIGPIDDASGKD